MFNEILFVATIFITRIALPIAITWFIGTRIERALNRGVRSAA